MGAIVHCESHLFELKFNGGRVHRRYRVCDVMSNPESLLFGLPSHIDEERVGITVNYLRTPFWCCINQTNSLLNNKSYVAETVGKITHFL